MDDSLIDEQNRAALESHDLAAEAGPDESGDDWPPDDEPPSTWPECEHKWRDYSEYGGDFIRTPIVCRDCGKAAPPEVAENWPEPDGSRYVPGVGWIATSR